ncbi:ABC transporter permease [Streptomyces europaeiscabiei]|uniref:ABC transporter permease n=2 Tax=Streptomyces europaeiscabiei TaxID=146819 RepID=A0ABU4NRM3_9ACTN|nr:MULTISPECIES: ABC transporter permease [Streptomyces]MDX2774153.1 ABC transporter permease [Streptomyces europaeiscabiei]MDX3548217.1 ABC transporter permease [Streptomyces europaeiscabiei]MDX3557277.1 ABC transporter permease [Streptomyces europaeiscabiei]MDX3673154.1 ABC transporter permease [Streptomyces europaeiscabiei]MDX3704984.1 ABC transporter permease [Streptomyces europaeiscabiei]
MAETVAAIRAEVTKLRGVRGTLVALLLFVPVSVLIAALGGWSAKGAIESDSPGLRSDFTPEQAGLDGILYGQLALIVFGVLIVTSEYTSGMMRVSLLAVPRRGRLYAAKMAVTAVAAAAIAIPVTVVSYLVTQLALGPHGAAIDASGVPRALAGAVVYLMLMSLFAAGVATMARSAILPLAILLPMVLAGSQILSVIGATKEVARYFPDQAGMRMLTIDSHDAYTGFAVLLVWTVAALAVGYLRHSRWDA